MILEKSAIGEEPDKWKPRLRITRRVPVSFTCAGCQLVIDLVLVPVKNAGPPPGTDDTIGAIRCGCGHITKAVDVIPIQPGVELAAASA